jgi:hypothetical protein
MDIEGSTHLASSACIQLVTLVLVLFTKELLLSVDDVNRSVSPCTFQAFSPEGRSGERGHKPPHQDNPDCQEREESREG